LDSSAGCSAESQEGRRSPTRVAIVARRATPKREEHLYRRAATGCSERAAARQAADDCQPETGAVRMLPTGSCSMPAICNDDLQFVTHLADRHVDGTGRGLRICVLHHVGYCLADAELDRGNLHVRQTQVASNGLRDVPKGSDAVLSSIGGCMQRRRHREYRTRLCHVFNDPKHWAAGISGGRGRSSRLAS
jgi:hypothetical protein